MCIDKKSFIYISGVVNSNKALLFEMFSLIGSENIDFVDALICAKSKLEGFGKLSFDEDVNKCGV